MITCASPWRSAPSATGERMHARKFFGGARCYSRLRGRCASSSASSARRLVFDGKALPLILRPAVAVPADLVHLAEELQAIAFGIVEIEGVVVARALVLDGSDLGRILRDHVAAGEL